MAVEKMKLMGAIGCIDDIDMISEEMVKCGCIHAVNALDEISRYAEYENGEGKGIIRQFEKPYGDERVKNSIKEIMDELEIELLEFKDYIDENISMEEIAKTIAPIYEEVISCRREIDNAHEEIEGMIELQEHLYEIIDVKYPLSDIRKLKYFHMSIGRLRKNSYDKLKENIENIPSIIYRLSRRKKYTVIISFTPLHMLSQVQDIFKSLGYDEIIIPQGVAGVPEDIIQGLSGLIDEKKQIIKQNQDRKKELKSKWLRVIMKYWSLVMKYERMGYLDRGAVKTDHLFYICGWIPESDRIEMEEELKHIDDKLVMMYRDAHEVEMLTPPTKLKNSKLVKPFEYLVNMYGIPDYNEIDPTPFVAVTYMIMFGAMFGDAGQGLVLLIGGLYLLLSRKSPDFGGILTGIGISSIIFGFFYGSLFGVETIIKPLILRPMENINAILASGIVFGIILSMAGYILSLINLYRMKNFEEGIFGREGASGFLLYLTLLFTAYSIYKGLNIPLWAILAFILLLVLLIVMKQPIARLIERKKPLYDDTAGNYYVEGIFGMVETLLSMLSSTISFVRIGAFALNHAGLFTAFSTVSAMISQRAGSIAVMVLGNIIIIGLEGLVVIIQGLRLEYYEIFSKFYHGDGQEYRPVCVLQKEDKGQ